MSFTEGTITQVLKPEFFALKSTPSCQKILGIARCLFALKTFLSGCQSVWVMKYAKPSGIYEIRHFTQKLCQVFFTSFLTFLLSSYKISCIKILCLILKTY